MLSGARQVRANLDITTGGMIPDGSPSLPTQYAYDLPLATTLFSTELWVTLQGGLSLHASAAPGHVSSTSSLTLLEEGQDDLRKDALQLEVSHFERRVMEWSSSSCTREVGSLGKGEPL